MACCSYNHETDPVTGEEIYFPKQWSTYKEFLTRIAEDIVIERVRGIRDANMDLDKWLAHPTINKKNLENTELGLRYYIRAYGKDSLPVLAMIIIAK